MFTEIKPHLDVDYRTYLNMLAAASKKVADDMEGAAGWFMVRVNLRQEQKIYERMQRAGLDVWLPYTTETKIRAERKEHKRRGQRRKLVKEPERVLVFDGFVLVRFLPTATAWHGIMGILGVQSIYANPESFHLNSAAKRHESALNEKVVDRLRELEAETHGEEYKPKFKIGDIVDITAGPFKGYSGTVADANKWGLVKIEVMAGTRLIPVTLEENQVNGVA